MLQVEFDCVDRLGPAGDDLKTTRGSHQTMEIGEEARFVSHVFRAARGGGRSASPARSRHECQQFPALAEGMFWARGEGIVLERRKCAETSADLLPRTARGSGSGPRAPLVGTSMSFDLSTRSPGHGREPIEFPVPCSAHRRGRATRGGRAGRRDWETVPPRTIHLHSQCPLLTYSLQPTAL